ncbi:MAG: DNA polymerase III subunit delta' C-terminal domain-containing protein [Buchnera aphidicola (Meitanaphis elongallis)]
MANYLLPQYYSSFKKKNNRSIILTTYKGIGTILLIKIIGCWLLCSNKDKNIFYCKQCKSCQLMNSKNHPDWYNVQLLSNRNVIGIDIIRWLCNQMLKTSKRNGNKVVYFSDISRLTEHSMNALLKILEEPPKNTYFLFINYFSLSLLPTLRSRCILYTISTPLEKTSIHWLKEKNSNIKENTFKTALRINQGSPIFAKTFLYTPLWKERHTFLYHLKRSIVDKNFLCMLDNFNLGNIEKKIFWLCTLLFDAIKMQHNDIKNLINLDKKNIIIFFKKKYSFFALDNSLRSWMYCNFKIANNIYGINTELLLIEQLLRWENILKLRMY